TVYTLPVVNAGVDQTICNASPVILAGSGALSYAWDNAVTNATPFFPSSTATYTVVGTDANGCQNQDQVIVNVLPQPIVLGGLDQTICAGTPIILNASTTSATPTAVTGFQWSNNIPNNTQYVPTNSATLTVTATGANGCTNQDQILVTVLALPTVNAGQDITVCAGLSATLNASGAVSYAWNNGVTQGIPFYPNASQTYTVVGTGANGCTNNDQVVVTVSTGPTVNLSTPQTVCANTPATLSAAVQNSLGGFWTTTNGSGVISPNVTNGTVTYTPALTDPVVVNLTYVATNACGSASQNTTVTVLPIPVINAGPDFSVCQGASATLTATGTGFLTWTTPNVTNGVAFVPATTATYNVVATGFNNCTNSDQVTVTVLALPDVNAGADQTICSGESVTLNGEGAVSYQWTGGAANGVAFAPSTTATYSVTGTGVNGCENTDQVTVVVNATPVATISVVNDVTLAATPAGMNYQWINCASGTDAPNGSTANFTAIANGSYAVIVTSAEGCSDQSDCEVIDAVGLDQIAAIAMSVNPNPTAGDLTINMPTELTAQAQVFDAQGKLVLDASNVSNGSVLSLVNMTTGVYMVRITADNSVQTFRVVKQ
ncbi:MAG: T9SS C-terminal target domain-containing protein, partial [Flavobacteriia bacterium]